MRGFKEEVIITGTKFAILFGTISLIFLTMPILVLNQLYGLDCYQYTYQLNIEYCLKQDNIALIMAWSIPAIVVSASYVVGLMMYLLKL
ncbi:hypothetical protein [Bacillus phage SPO1L1]|nr:hypothetical protein [Bacillus phage SPO1L1]WIT26087.1 hypothetical protein [Bacillus phage SPO1L2]